MSWILIVMLVRSVNVSQFDSEKACLVAKNYLIAKKKDYAYIASVDCLEVPKK